MGTVLLLVVLWQHGSGNPDIALYRMETLKTCHQVEATLQETLSDNNNRILHMPALWDRAATRCVPMIAAEPTPDAEGGDHHI